MPSYLAANPGAGIQILAGVDNESGTMPVPEPGAGLLMQVGLAGLVGARRAVLPARRITARSTRGAPSR